MLIKNVLAGVLGALVLAGCATTVTPPKPPPSIAGILADAEMAIKAGRNEEGVAILKTATAAFPADKSAWLRIAQVEFECHNYGPAIYHAQQTIERDPNDMLAHSIVAASGLRVSSKALSDLVQKKNLTGSVRDEAQELARLLRSSLGSDIIVPVVKGGRKPMVKPAVPQAANRSRSTAGEGPEDWLNK